VKTRVQLALRRPRTVEEHEQVLAEIQTDIVRLTQLAEQLLAVGTGTPARSDADPTDLAAIANDEVARRNMLAVGHPDPTGPPQLRVRTSGAVLVGLEPTQVTQLINNLIDNAVLHGRSPIAVTVDKVSGAGRLAVADTVTAWPHTCSPRPPSGSPDPLSPGRGPG